MELEPMDSWHSRLVEIAASEGEGADFRLLWMMLHARVFIDDEGSGYRHLPPAGQTIWLVNLFVGEINNGGFYQFFSNSSGDHSAELPAALEALNAHSMLALFRRATRILRKDGVVPLDRNMRHDALDSMFPDEDDCYAAFDELDREFYALPDADHPDLMRYATEHRDQLNFTLSENERALESEPYLLFPTDRLACARFDTDTKIIDLELASGTHAVPLREVSTLAIAKVARAPGASGLVYRLDTHSSVIDVPFFARGDGGCNTVSWRFVDVLRSHRLVGFDDALAEARNQAAMQPIEIWRNTPGGKYLD